MIVGVLQLVIYNTLHIGVYVFFYLVEHSKFLLHTLQVLYMCTLCDSTGLFEMIVEVLTTYHTQYTSDNSICVFYLIEQHSKFLLHTLQVLYMCTLCDYTNINTIIEFVPNCVQYVSGDGFSGGSDSYLQFRDNCGKRRNINLILDVTPWKEITWGCIWRMRWQVVETPTIISNNPVYRKLAKLGAHFSQN